MGGDLHSMKLLAAFLILCSAATANTCVLAAGTYATLASTSTHWTGAGCTGAYVAGNGDTANLGTNSAILTIATAETWTIGTSGATGTAAVILGGGGVLHIAGTFRPRGDVTSGAGTSVVVDVQAGGSFIFDATQNLAALYEYNPSGSRIFQAVGTAGSCSYTNGYNYTGASCAVVTSDLSGGAAPGDITGDHTGAFNTSYAAFSNLGTASRRALYVGAYNFNAATNAVFHYTSLVNSGLVITDSNVNFDFSHFAINGGLNATDQAEDLEIFGTSNVVTQSLTDTSIKYGVKFISPGVMTLRRSYMFNAPSFGSATGATASNCGDLMLSTSGSDISFPCSIDTLLIVRNGFGVTGHLLAVPGVGSSGTTVNISQYYAEFPDADSGSNQGKALLTNSGLPSVPTQTNVTNMVLNCGKNGLGNSELTGGAGNVDSSTNLLTVTHATACVQAGIGGSQFTVIDENGVSNNTMNFQGNIMYAPGGNPFYKSLSSSPATPSTNVIKTADYNAAGSSFTATNASCPLCTVNGGSPGGLNGWTHKCANAAGVTCPAGAHDIGPISPGFANTNVRWATWPTLGPPAKPPCSQWGTGTIYTFDPLVPTCVSVTNIGINGGLAVNYILTSTNTSGATSKPDVGANWLSYWEYQTDWLMNVDSVNGTTYGGLTPASAFWAWVGTGLLPSASSYRFTFPGDTNAVTNVGAFQMGSGNAPRLRTVIMQ